MAKTLSQRVAALEAVVKPSKPATFHWKPKRIHAETPDDPSEIIEAKFIAGDGNVKVAFPAKNRRFIQAILDRNPPGKSDLNKVTMALAMKSAFFVPWRDGDPGHSGLYAGSMKRATIATSRHK